MEICSLCYGVGKKHMPGVNQDNVPACWECYGTGRQHYKAIDIPDGARIHLLDMEIGILNKTNHNTYVIRSESSDMIYNCYSDDMFSLAEKPGTGPLPLPG